MAPRADDRGITDQHFLLRALVLSKWIVAKENRPASDSIMDSNFENSCFVEEEITREEVTVFLRGEAQRLQNEGLLDQINKGLRFARLSVALIREVGFIIERRPQEAEGCANPNAHVVIGPPGEIRRIEYEKAARRIVKDPRTTIL